MTRFALLSIILPWALVAPALMAQSSPPEKEDSQTQQPQAAPDAEAAGSAESPEEVTPASPPRRRAGPPGVGGEGILRSTVDRMRSGRRARNPTPEDIDRFIQVVGALNPEWKASLETLRETDPEQFQKSLSSSRRLWQLVELQERNPNLYKLRLSELKNGEQLKSLGHAYRKAKEAGNDEEAERILGELQALALVQVDLQVRVRGEELAAMADAIERLRQKMMRDLEQRVLLAEELVERYLDPPTRPEGSSGGEFRQLRRGVEAGTEKMPESGES